MNTPTHILTAAAMLTQPGDRRRNLAVVIGGLLPDLSIFVLFGWARFIENMPHRQIWSEAYWQEPWQTVGAISNSFVLWGLAALVAFWLGWRALMFLGMAVLVHLALDLPVHASDAHKHFWPLTDWRFHSPFSYWQASHHSAWVRAIELALVLTSMFVLWRRFESRVVHGLLIVGLIGLAAGPLFFWITLH